MLNWQRVNTHVFVCRFSSSPKPILIHIRRTWKENEASEKKIFLKLIDRIIK